MNILMVLENPYPPDERVENEITILTKKGYHITLVCTVRGKGVPAEIRGNLEIHRLPLSKLIYKSGAVALLFPVYFLFWHYHLRRIINHSRFNVIHLHDLPLVKVVYKLAERYNLPVIYDYHENRPEIMKMYRHTQIFPGKYIISIKKWISYQIKYTQKVDNLILVTEEAKDYYISNYGIAADKITVLPNYISLERFPISKPSGDAGSSQEKGFTVAYFGDTGIRRGTITLLEAAEILKKRNIHFLIIGISREHGILQKMVQERGLNNVTFTGWVPVNVATGFLSNAHVGLCPFLRNIHHDTTYANKMFQYMALGKPVIVSNCTAQANLVRKEDCGLVFEAGDPQDLSNQITAITDQQVYNRLSKNALQCVKDKYNWERSGSRLLELYSSLEKN